jgi:hypothetical protein
MSRESRAARAAHSQLHLTDVRFVALTGQVKTVYERIDGAMVEALRLNANMIETAQEMGLEPEVGQKLFAGCCQSGANSSPLDALIAGRGNFRQR